MCTLTPIIVRRRLFAFGAMTCVALFVAFQDSMVTSAAELNPKREDRIVISAVVSLLTRNHLSGHALDDEISQRAFDGFLKSLDPMKLYFTQSDIDEFAKRRDRLDDLLKERDVQFAFDVYKRFLQRTDERIETVKVLLGQKNDFTVEEEIIVDTGAVRYPRDEDEVRDRWRKQIKYDLLVLKTDGVEDKQARITLARRYDSFAKQIRQLENDDLMEMFLTAVTTSFDPHSVFFSKKSLVNERIKQQARLEGIGAALRSSEGQTIVARIIPGSAADRHGKLKVEDHIVGIAQGDDGEMLDIRGKRLGDVVGLIRGESGTKIRLAVIHTGDKEQKVYTITRGSIALTDRQARGVVVEHGKGSDDKPLKIGIIKLPEFYRDVAAAKRGDADFASASRDLKKIVERLKSQDVAAIILDLRQNGDGSFVEAINCLGMFIDKGPVVQIKDRAGKVTTFNDDHAGVAWDGPLVVVTSKLTTSIAEIFAAGIQDYRRGLIIGDKTTRGQGTVQSLLDIGSQIFRIANARNLGALKFTTQQSFRISGDSIQRLGVTADIVLPSLSNHMDVGEGNLDHAIPFDRVPSVDFKKFDALNEETLKSLRDNSGKRQLHSVEFKQLLKNIENYRERKDRKSISLNEKKHVSERVTSDRLQPKPGKSRDENSAQDFYLSEVLNITADYVKTIDK